MGNDNNQNDNKFFVQKVTLDIPVPFGYRIVGYGKTKDVKYLLKESVIYCSDPWSRRQDNILAESIKAPEGFEFTGEIKIPTEDEHCLDCDIVGFAYNKPAINFNINGGKRYILRKIRTPEEYLKSVLENTIAKKITLESIIALEASINSYKSKVGI